MPNNPSFRQISTTKRKLDKIDQELFMKMTQK